MRPIFIFMVLYGPLVHGSSIRKAIAKSGKLYEIEVEDVKSKFQRLQDAGSEYSDSDVNYEDSEKSANRFKAVSHGHDVDNEETTTRNAIGSVEEEIADDSEEGSDYYEENNENKYKSNEATYPGLGYQVDPALQHMMERVRDVQLRQAYL